MGDAGIAQLQIGAVIDRAVQGDGAVQIQDGGIVEPDAVAGLVHPPAGDETRGGLHALRLSGKAVLVPIAADASCAVAAHLAQTAVGIVKAHAVIAAVLGRNHQHQPVGPQRGVHGAETSRQRRHRLRGQLRLPVVEENEVVAGSVHFGKLHDGFQSAPEGGEGGNELLLSGHHTGQEEHIVLRLGVEGLADDLVAAHIQQV